MQGNKTSDNRHTKPFLNKLILALGWVFVVAGVVFAVALNSSYRRIGDTTLLGETLTIWPPLVWLPPLMAVFSLGVFTRSWRAFQLAAASILLVCSNEDMEGLFTAKPSMERKVGTRIATWNIAGRTDWPQLLDELKPWKPDIVFLQETPDGNALLTTESVSGFWKGFDWVDQGDCGILSRYPLTHLPSTKIGPWDKPALAATVIPEVGSTTRSVLLCNVRMMLPAAATSPDRWFADPAYMRTAHEARVLQYKKLAELLATTTLQLEIDDVVLGGDFNVRGGSKSLAPLIEGDLRDVWPESGGGWGATVLADFPMARIDQLWVSAQWLPMQSRTVVGEASDHRMVILDLLPK